jgi:hypothetical protein
MEKNDGAASLVRSDALFGNWIPVSERVPKPETEVLVAVDSRKQTVARIEQNLLGAPADRIEWVPGEVTEGYYGEFRGKVTHWMPLPPLPNYGNMQDPGSA